MYNGIAELAKELSGLDRKALSIGECLELYERKGVSFVLGSGRIEAFYTRED